MRVEVLTIVLPKKESKAEKVERLLFMRSQIDMRKYCCMMMQCDKVIDCKQITFVHCIMYSDIRLNSTCNLPMISDLVMATRSPSSTAKAGKEMTDRRPASISLEVEALGSMEQRMD